jgi:hypothetical protein
VGQAQKQASRSRPQNGFHFISPDDSKLKKQLIYGDIQHYDQKDKQAPVYLSEIKIYRDSCNNS